MIMQHLFKMSSNVKIQYWFNFGSFVCAFVLVCVCVCAGVCVCRAVQSSGRIRVRKCFCLMASAELQRLKNRRSGLKTLLLSSPLCPSVSVTPRSHGSWRAHTHTHKKHCAPAGLISFKPPKQRDSSITITLLPWSTPPLLSSSATK